LYSSHDNLSGQFKEMQQKYSDVDGEHTLLMIEVENRHYIELQQKQSTICNLEDNAQVFKKVIGISTLQNKNLKQELNKIRQSTNELIAHYSNSMRCLQDNIQLLGLQVSSLSTQNNDFKQRHNTNLGKLSDLEQRYADILSKAVETERNWINLNRVNAEKGMTQLAPSIHLFVSLSRLHLTYS